MIQELLVRTLNNSGVAAQEVLILSNNMEEVQVRGAIHLRKVQGLMLEDMLQQEDLELQGGMQLETWVKPVLWEVEVL